MKHAIAAGTPVEVVDPATNEVFYLLSAEQFRLLSATLAPGENPQDHYPQVDLMMAADDKNDPLLDSYQ
ncbi:MAG: hypothetical protein U0805_09005 [Pirellulales bacterium]